MSLPAKRSKRSLVFAVALLGSGAAVATMVTGVTFGFFSASSPTQGGTLTSGTVSLAQSAVTSCTVSNIQPGDSGSCHFTVTYSGTTSGGAWLGVDLSVTNPVAGSPSQSYAPGNTGTTPTAAGGLYDSTATGLQLTIADNQSAPVTYMSGRSWNGGSTTGTTPSVADLLVNTTPFTSTTAITFTINWSLPSTANNAYEGAASTVNLFVHAVQAADNGSTTSCTAGLTCSGITNWS